MAYSAFKARKVILPALPRRHVPRPRLVRALDEAVERPLTLVSAGPGWGKTVLLSEWARTRDEPVVWLSLDDDDDRETAFWNLVSAGLEQANVAGGSRQPSTVWSSADDAVDAIVASVSGRDTPVFLVIDDAHVITNPDLLRRLDLALRHPMPNLRIVMAARRDPVIPLHRYRVDGTLSELRAADVAMTGAEVGRLLAAHEVTLSADRQATLAVRTEGWVAGVRLSALRMERTVDPDEFVDEFAVDRGSIGEYLMEEVLATQPPDVRRLLLVTSLAGAICGPLADAMTGGRDGTEILNDLALSNSFVTPVAREPGWFHYHPLLREILRYLLDRETSEERAELHRRAARWHHHEGNDWEALQHATRAGDSSFVADSLAGGAFESVFLRFGVQPVDHLDAFLATTPAAGATPGSAAQLVAVQAAVSGVTGRNQRAAESLRRLEPFELVGRSRELAVCAELSMAQAAGDLRAVERAADELGTCGSIVVRAHAEAVRGSVLHWLGEAGRARDVLTAAVDLARQAAAPAIEVRCLGILSLGAGIEGRLDTAETYVNRAVIAARAYRSDDGADVAALSLASAQLGLYRGEADTLAELLRRAENALPGVDDPNMRRLCRVLAAGDRQMRGRHDEALHILADGDPADPGASRLDAVATTLVADSLVHTGRPNAALRALRSADASADRLVPHLSALSHARVQLALGNLGAADDFIRRVVAASAPAARTPVLVSAILLAAEVADARRDETAAVEAVTTAIELAGEGLVLPFATEHPRFRVLLSRHPVLSDRWPGPVFAADDALLAAVPEQRMVDRLQDPLTERELSVLRWLTTTRSTSEIAVELCVSTNTVKTHVAAIYRKLDAGRRRDAVARARSLQLI